MHIDYSETAQSVNSEISKCKNCTLEELAILREISNNPSITQKTLAEAIGKSERTVKSRTVDLQDRGLLRLIKTEILTRRIKNEYENRIWTAGGMGGWIANLRKSIHI